jgi:uncharacterized protein (DUF2147 family)
MPLIAFALLLAAPPPATPAIAGTWKTEDGKALVRIAPCGANWCGRIVKLLVAPPPGKGHDVNNPDPALRGRPILGLTILTGFSRQDGEWQGAIYDPQHGKSYRSILEPGDGGTLKVKGCISIFCKTQIWQPGS